MSNDTQTQETHSVPSFITGSNPINLYRFTTDIFGTTVFVSDSSFDQAYDELIDAMGDSGRHTCDHGGDITDEQRWTQLAGDADSTCDCTSSDSGIFVWDVEVRGREFLSASTSGNDAPCSRYGTRSRDWVPVAIEYIAAKAEHLDITECADDLISAVVNDSQDVADVLRDVDSYAYDPEWHEL